MPSATLGTGPYLLFSQKTNILPKILYFNTQPSVEALNPATEPADAVPAEDAAPIRQQ